MKRKKNQKPENTKTIDPALLDEILGGTQVSDGGTKTVVIEQPSFKSFFHS